MKFVTIVATPERKVAEFEFTYHSADGQKWMTVETAWRNNVDELDTAIKNGYAIAPGSIANVLIINGQR